MGLTFDVKYLGLYDKIVLIVLAISAFCSWISYTCNGWGEVFDGSNRGLQYGLWRVCDSRGERTHYPMCAHAVGWATDWYTATQALVTLGFLGVNAALVLHAMYMFQPKCMGKAEIAISTALVCLVTGLFYLVGVIVFGAMFNEDFIDEANIVTVRLGYSYGLSVVAMLLEIFAGLMVLVINFKATQTNPQVPAGTCSA